MQKQQNKDQEKGKQDIFRSLFDPKAQENCDVAMYTGCTATVCCFDDKKAYFANAGDSRSAICRNG